MKKFTAVNQKGGVGKTNTNCNFAFYLAECGHRTLIINGDEQEDANDTMADFLLPGLFTHQLFEQKLLEVPAFSNKLTLIPSHRESLREIEESAVDDMELVTNLICRLGELAPYFDYAIFDTAGANSRIANAFLIASDFATVPTKIDEHSIRETVETIGRIGGIKSHPDPRVRNENLVFLGILVNEYDPRQPYQVKQFSSLLNTHADLMVPFAITDRQAYREAISSRVPVWRLKSEEGRCIKTTAREAGKEIHAVFTYFKRIIDSPTVTR
ncbi:ParA family protein [Massilia sp. DD77]|uniref:ParA family protein n=1 Tax=Massilia sp. DD77 TaxID=3109349 RepID=UPI002FFE154C